MMQKRQAGDDGTPSAGKTLWVYGYEMLPPHQEHRLAALRTLLERENVEAKRDARTWTARLVTEQTATHVLVVSTSPEQDLINNRTLEAGLKAIGVEYVMTMPMPVRDSESEERDGEAI